MNVIIEYRSYQLQIYLGHVSVGTHNGAYSIPVTDTMGIMITMTTITILTQ